ncbi:MAG: flavodoxin domain-containing protein [Brevefilum sp.]|nr:flavodoxin domain-containing protein [Brevefilum sp.]
MTKKILLAYGTASGSTAEVAQAIADEMAKADVQVDVFPVEEVNDLSGYDAVVVGTAVRMFHLLPKTRRFLRRHRKGLSKVPVAYFLVCLTLSEETPENIQKATDFAKPMIKTKAPVSLGLFGGCINHEKMTDIFGKSMRSLPEQDHRDWDKIRTWASETLPKLLENE